jgi:hypothetical protein
VGKLAVSIIAAAVFLGAQYAPPGGAAGTIAPGSVTPAMLALPGVIPIGDGTILLHYSNVPIANAQVLTLHSAPVVLVPAQGAGTFLEVVSTVNEHLFATATFTGGGTTTIVYGVGGSSAGTAFAAGLLVGPVVNQMNVSGLTTTTQAASVLLNKPLVLSTAGADFAAGGGSLIVHLTYRVHTGL